MRNGPMQLADALRYSLQIADALLHAWEREVVHRDIKPSNILITPEGQAKLVDMGLARLENAEQADHELTATGVTLGTFDYISPEQARDARNADIRSDIYSLGCTLFFLLVGKPPFPDGTALQKLLQHQGDDAAEFAAVAARCAGVGRRSGRYDAGQAARGPLPESGRVAGGVDRCTEQLGMAYPQISLPQNWRAERRRTKVGGTAHAYWLVPARCCYSAVRSARIRLAPTASSAGVSAATTSMRPYRPALPAIRRTTASAHQGETTEK